MKTADVERLFTDLRTGLPAAFTARALLDIVAGLEREEALLTAERLRFCLPRDADREWFGGFNGEKWDQDALASVIVLR